MSDTALTDFTVLHESMCDELRNKMPFLNTVEAYDPTVEKGHFACVSTPAVLIEMVEMKPASRVSDERKPFDCEFIFHCILSSRTKNVQLEIRNLAAYVAGIVDLNRWGLAGAVTAPKGLGAYAGAFKKGDHGFESWVVSMTQKLYLGQMSTDNFTIPHDIYLGEAPRVGAGHESDYEKLTPAYP